MSGKNRLSHFHVVLSYKVTKNGFGIIFIVVSIFDLMVHMICCDSEYLKCAENLRKRESQLNLLHGTEKQKKQ